MSIKRDDKGRRRPARRKGFSVESLERRVVLASSSVTFVGPSLAGLITQAEHGKSITPAINQMLNALESQMLAGPLADLNSGSIARSLFIVEANGLEASFESNVDQQFGGHFPNADELLKLQGRRVVAELISSNQQGDAGLVPVAGLPASFETTIRSLTAGPIYPQGTTPATLTAATQLIKADLQILGSNLANATMTTKQVSVTGGAELEAYRAEVQAGIQLSQPRISGEADAAITQAESSINALASTQAAPSTAAPGLTSAIQAFNSSVLDTNGLFGPRGAFRRSRNVNLREGASSGQDISQFAAISGTLGAGGTAVLTAKLTSFNGSALGGRPVNFILNGEYAGVAVTNFNGVATIVGPSTITPAPGVLTAAIVAVFPSDTNYLAARGVGDLTITQGPTTLVGVSGTASYGGMATVSASLVSSVTGLGLAGQPVSFTLDGSSIGTVATNAAGTATLPGVATTGKGASTDTGGIVATFAGSGNNASTASSGNLVIAPAGTSLAGVTGSALFGGVATLKASLVSSVTGLGVSGQAVSFSLDNVVVGTATTDATGQATLAGVATSDGIGTDVGGIVATFSGSTNYSAAAAASGNLLVSQSGSSVTAVGGTAAFGGPATLNATLTSSANTQGIAGQAISFNLNGIQVGTAVTNANGVATLAGVPSTASVGTQSNAIFATFAGTSSYATSNATGDLVVTQVATALSSVSGSAQFGGTATLLATLTSTSNNAGVAGQMISFSLNNASVGTAVTNANGVATLTGVASNFAVGATNGAVSASFAGGTNYSAAAATTGILNVSKAGPALSAVSATAIQGGMATLTATLMSSVTNVGIADEAVQFVLDGVTVGSAFTNASGVATLTGVATSDAAGTHAGAVVASFAGDANYQAAANASGDLVVGQSGSTLGAVSATSSFGGPATLSASLKTSGTSQGIAGQAVDFKLDGVSVGSAITDASGLATLTGVTTTDAVGTHSGAVVASFPGNASYEAAADTSGDLVVSQAGAALLAISGASSFGGPATLTTTLRSSVTNQGIAGQVVDFKLDGVSVGSVVTDASGLATLTGVATSDAAGNHNGVVVVSYSGNASYSAIAAAEGGLLVSQAGSALSAVSGNGTFGGRAGLSATLKSTVTGLPIAGESVLFTVDGTAEGQALTDANGLAILTNVSTSDAVGTHAGAVVASYAGGVNYAASNAGGDLTIQGTTTLSPVGGVAPVGGPATLTATLTSNGGMALVGRTVSFLLDGVAVGTAVTDGTGLATLTGVPTTDSVGTDAGGVIATYAGETYYVASQGTGDLVVS